MGGLRGVHLRCWVLGLSRVYVPPPESGWRPKVTDAVVMREGRSLVLKEHVQFDSF